MTKYFCRFFTVAALVFNTIINVIDFIDNFMPRPQKNFTPVILPASLPPTPIFQPMAVFISSPTLLIDSVTVVANFETPLEAPAPEVLEEPPAEELAIYPEMPEAEDQAGKEAL